MKPGAILFSIQHHGNDVANLFELIKSLRSDASAFDVFLDSPEAVVTDVRARISELSIDNASIQKSGPVVWSGPSQITQWREALDSSLKIEGWEWFVNLSGACAPLKGIKYIGDFINANVASKGAALNAFPVKKPVDWIRYEHGAEAELRIGRVPALVDAAILKRINEKTFNPAEILPQRWGLRCDERNHGGTKGLLLRGLHPREILDRQQFFRTYNPFAGRVWVILHREVVEWMASSDCVRTIASELCSMQFADELFFQMALKNSPDHILSRTSFSNNYRASLGEAISLSKVKFEELISDAPCLFGRKAVESIDYTAEFEMRGFK